MSGVVHLHRKVVVSLSVGSLPTYLVFFFFFWLIMGGKKRKRETGSAMDLTVNLVDYDRCVRLCR